MTTLVYDEGELSQWQGHDYAIVNDNGKPLLIMLLYGSSDGVMTDRTGRVVVSEEELIKIAEEIRATMAIKFGFNPEECPIAAAPCYPNVIRARVKTLVILGDWDTRTCANDNFMGQFTVGSCP